MARAALAIAFLAAGCGLVGRDYTVQTTFTAGGGAPTNAQFNTTELLSPLSADVSKVSSVTLKTVTLTSLDSGDLSFVSGMQITATGNNLPAITLATLLAAPAAGTTSVQLQLGSDTDLKPYLEAGGLLGATATYSPFPATARSLQLTLVIHGSLL